jgi:hypothetical protein
VFDIGVEQLGEYFAIAQPPEDGAEEDAPPVILSRWNAHKTQKLSNMYEPTPEELAQEAALAAEKLRSTAEGNLQNLLS